MKNRFWDWIRGNRELTPAEITGNVRKAPRWTMHGRIHRGWDRETGSPTLENLKRQQVSLDILVRTPSRSIGTPRFLLLLEEGPYGPL